jgi:two-component sensor histidine kinase
MQGTYVRDEGLQEVLGDCQGRVRSMALVHEHIYRVGDLNRVNVKAHLVALAGAVLKQHGLQDRVTLDLHVNYDHANLDNLIPLSLLMNELLTNSAKHAFTGRDSGRITVVLRRLGDSQCELVFSDDGVGMRQEQFFHVDSFGLELVRTLATQLDGRISLLKGEGTTFQMTFEPQARPIRRAS